jgi:DNA polymerase-3 subunit delta
MILTLFGADTYRSKRKLEEIRARFLSEIDVSGLNLNEFEASEAEESEIKSAIFSAPFLSKKRLVIVKNIFSAAKKSAARQGLMEMMKDAPEETILVVYETADREKLSKTKQFATLSNPKFYPEFTPLSGKTLERWIVEEATRRGFSFADDGFRAYATHCGTDLWKIANELDALDAYAKSYGAAIGATAVGLLADVRVEAGLFDFLDAVGAKNPKSATAILESLLDQGESEVLLITRLQQHFRNLLLCHEFLEYGMTSKEQISRELGVHPFATTKLMSQARRFDGRELRRAYEWLIDADEQQKTGRWTLQRMPIDLLMLHLSGDHFMA